MGPLPPPPGGMANQTRQLAQLLEQEGFHVEVVRTNAPYRPAWIESVRGVRALFRLIPFVVDLWRVAGRVGLFHVMASSGWSWHILAAPAVWVAKLRGIPVLVNYRGGDAAEFFKRSILWVRPTMTASDRRVVPSGYLKKVFSSFGLSSEIVPNIIDLDRFTARASTRCRRSTGAHIVVARNLEPLYDVATALQAFGIVHQQRPDARMTIAGGGPERARLVAMAEELGVTPYVTFTGRLDNSAMADLYRRADVFVNSSLHDNMPISILEALAVGVPVVSSDVCGIPYLVEHRKTALLVHPRDPAAIARCVLELLGDQGLYDELVCAGRELVQQFAWQKVRPRLLDVYSKLTGDHQVNADRAEPR